MARLHIEHAITDLTTWLDAFNSFEQARRDAGVTTQQVHQPSDDDKYIVVDLDFASVEAANNFKDFLEQVIWQTPEMSPGLAGTPRARVLDKGGHGDIGVRPLGRCSIDAGSRLPLAEHLKVKALLGSRFKVFDAARTP